MLAANPIISEVMASNQAALTDSFGETPDWIEIHNAGDEPANLNGWFLTDNLERRDKWRFPSVSVEPGGFLLVHASGRNLANAVDALHTNFRLSVDGESVALVRPDGEQIASQVTFGRQLADVSYGVSMKTSSTALVGGESNKQWLIPDDDSLGSSWTQVGDVLDDRWMTIPGAPRGEPWAIGYDRGTLLVDPGRYAEAILGDRPTAFWRFEEPGGRLADNLGSIGLEAEALHSRETRPLTDGVLPGALDYAVALVQADEQKIEIPFHEDLNRPDFTVEAWARLESGSGYRSIVTSRDNSPQSGFILYAAPDDTWEFWTGNGLRSWNIVRGSTANSGIWTHLVGTYDSTTQQQILYVDGVEAGSIAASFAPNTTNLMRIGGGATEGPADFFFDGAIDEVAIYDRVLTPEAVNTHFELGKPLPVSVEEQQLMLAEFENSGPAELGVDAASLRLAGKTSEHATLANPDGRLLMQGGGTGSAVFIAPVQKLTFDDPIVIRTDASWEVGTAPETDDNAFFGLVALHRSGVGATGGDRKGGLFAMAQPRRSGLLDLRLGFQTDSTGTFRDSFVVTSSSSMDSLIDAGSPIQLELIMDGLQQDAVLRFRIIQGAVVEEITTTIGDVRRALVDGSSVQLALDAVLDDLRNDPAGMNVGLIRTRANGASTRNIAAYERFEIATQSASDESVVANYTEQIQTDLEASMYGRRSTAYLRMPFDVGEAEPFRELSLLTRYDDGIVAYLNGTEIARRNAPEPVLWNSAAVMARNDSSALVFESIDVSPHISALRNGNNVLAIQGLNRGMEDSDFLIEAQLESRQTTIDESQLVFYGRSSPGEPNVAGAELGPIIEHVEHSPATPSVSDRIVVTAKLDETHSAESVLLSYRTMYDSLHTLSMRDDGQLGDLLAGDGIYSAEIPAGLADSGQMIRYFVTTTGTSGHRFRSPYLPNPAQTDGYPVYHGVVLADVSDDTPLPIFSWFVPDPRWHVSGGGNNQRWSEASVYYDGSFYDNVRVRVRGLTTSNWQKPKLKFEFNDRHYFRYSPDFPPVEEFNLQSHYRETGAVSYMGETLAFQWLREIGVAAPNAFPMHVRQNGTFYSLASFVEQIDETFLNRNGFDPEGAMYKANSAAVMSTLRPNPTAAHYRKITRQDEPFDDLRYLTDGVNNRLPNIDRSTFIFDSIDLPQVINDMAGNVIMPNHDRLTKNYYMHQDINGTGLWSRFPWDMDQAFARFTAPNFASVLYGDSEHPQSLNPIHQNHLYDAILDTPATREMYLRRVRTLVDDYLATGYFEREVDRYHELLAEDAARDNAKWRAGNIRGGVSRIKSNVAFRLRQLESEGLLPGATPINTDMILLAANSPVTAFVPQNDALGDSWTGAAEPFDDSDWIAGTAGVGFDNGQNPRYLAEINTLMEPRTICDQCTSIYSRFEFQVDDPTEISTLILQMKFDDGFIAYLNGKQVWKQNVSNSEWNSVAAAASQETLEFASFDISSFREELSRRRNILAIHTLNASRFSNDMLTSPQLLAGRVVPQGMPIQLGHVEFNPASGNQDEEFIEIVNSGDLSIDISDWQLTGGINHRFQHGTVIPAHHTMYVSPDVSAFRQRQADPTGGMGLFVVGNYDGHLSNFGETVRLLSAEGEIVDTHVTPTAPSDAQLFLRISELHYHPADDLQPEFIEFTNISDGNDAVPLDLSGVTIVQGPSEPFVFEPGTRLAAGETLLVSNDIDAMMVTYPAVGPARIAGAFAGRLNNGGEEIKVDDANGSTVVQFTYQDRHPWPIAADGLGASLHLSNLNAASDDPQQWHAANPSPGRLHTIDGDLNLDGLIDETDISRMCQLVAEAQPSADFSGDGAIDQRDIRAFVEIAVRTQIGDANLDGQFDSSDFVRVFQLGEYEDNADNNSTWSEGDWNCSGDFGTDDLVFAFQAGGFVAAAAPALRSINSGVSYASESVEAAADAGRLITIAQISLPKATQTLLPRRSQEFQVRELIFDDWHQPERPAGSQPQHNRLSGRLIAGLTPDDHIP